MGMTMESSKVRMVRKIRLLVDMEDKEERQTTISTLYRWQDICFKAANMIVSHLFVQEQVKEFLYLSEGVKVKLADEGKDPSGIFNCSKTNTSYKVLSQRFKGEVPMNIISCLVMSLSATFQKNLARYRKGEQSLSNFRRDIPIPFGPVNVSGLRCDEEKRIFRFSLFRTPFKTYLGRDFSDKRLLLQQLMEGKVKLCTSSLQLREGKILWLATFEIEKEKHGLKEDIIAEASLSLEYPITVRVGRAVATIGNREEFLYRRLAIQSALRRGQLGATFNRSGKGRKRKTRNLERFRQAERRYVDSRLHVYSRKLIDFCIKHRAGTLLLVNQQEKEELAREEKFVLRNWSYYELLTKIKYKAERAGIEVIVE